MSSSCLNINKNVMDNCVMYRPGQKLTFHYRLVVIDANGRKRKQSFKRMLAR